MRIFVINPGSTSTKLALFEDEECLFKTNVFHSSLELAAFKDLYAQLPYRLKVIEAFLEANKIDLRGVGAIIGRGGGMRPITSGVFRVDAQMIEDVENNVAHTNHPSALGILLAKELQKKYGGLLLTGDVICVDEYCEQARMTGIKGVYRHSHTHALNAKGTARLQAKKLGKRYEDCNFIVAHIDGGITVSCHKKGRMIDATDGTGGEGAYTPSRCGAVGAIELLDYLKEHDFQEVYKLFSATGGMISLLGSNDADAIHQRVEAGDQEALRAWEGMIYNIIKAIGSFATVLEGEVDNIILTGGLLRFEDIVAKIAKACAFIAPLAIYPGEVEMEALAHLALQVLRGEKEALIYGENLVQYE